jgi:adenine-specific DNA-methyltransferase
VIKYLGSKRRLVGLILDVVRSFPEVATVVDLFSGTSRVGHALKRAGYRVLANDHNAYAQVLARCYVQADREEVLPESERLLSELDRLEGTPGWFTETYCRQARFFQARNGGRIEAIREAIAERALSPDVEAVALTALMEAADRVDSTTGVQMAYLKQWAPRAERPLQLRLPEVLPRPPAGKGAAHGLEALAAAERLPGDLAYLDPPYNQHSYLGNYHIWETLVRWDRPQTYGVARKRVDCRSRRSPLNSKRHSAATLARLIERIRAPLLVVSFNDEGHVGRDELERLLGRRGRVTVLEVDQRRYVGAQIGIHNPRGEKVGRVGRLRNTESLYIVTPAERPAPRLRLSDPAVRVRVAAGD